MASSDPSVVDRVAHYIAENRRAVLLGTAAAAVVLGGTAAYYASASSSSGTTSKPKTKSSKSKKSAKKGVNDPDGPLVEEIQPKSEPASDVVPTPEEIAAMSTEERLTLAASYKSKGNTAYTGRKFESAVELYTNAINVSPKEEPVFYSNRAACYMNLSPPNYELVVEDCNRALALDGKYVKALNRRATAYESLERFEDALHDFTAATILDRFTNQAAAQSVDRVLRKLSEATAKELLSSREPRLPPHTFISAYFAAFREKVRPTLPENPTTGDNTLDMALGALESGNFAHAVTLVNEALEQGISTDLAKAEALNLRGTFKFLTSDVEGSKTDLLESIALNPDNTQSFVKLASVYMEQGKPVEASQCFEDAIAKNPNDPDIYYHRGQVLFIMGSYEEAAKNYTQSLELDDSFVFSHIQLAVAEYKQEQLAKSMATFRRTLRVFPQRSEPQNYYGELLLDQQRYDDAIEKFDRAIELEKDPIEGNKKSGPMNVLPMVNKALALYQGRNDIVAAEEYCREALAVDAECEAAVATLAQLNIQQGKTEEASQYLAKQVDLARTEGELVSALSYQYASLAQLKFLNSYPEMRAQLGAMAQGMAMAA